MNFPQFKVTNDVPTRNIILRKLIIVRAFFLQLFVPYTLLDAITILKSVETGIIFCNDKINKILYFLHLNVVRCKFIPVQWMIM